VTQLKKLAFGSHRVRRNILEKADPCFVKLLRECVLNFLQKKVDIGSDKKRKLHCYLPTLVTLAKPRTSNCRSRQLLQQRGGFLPMLLPAIISLVSGVAGEALGRAIHRNGR
jgi:hypothetical protein